MRQRLFAGLLYVVVVVVVGLLQILWRFVRFAVADFLRLLFLGSLILVTQAPIVREVFAKVEVQPEGYGIAIVLALVCVFVAGYQGLRSPWTRGFRRRSAFRRHARRTSNRYPSAHELLELRNRR